MNNLTIECILTLFICVTSLYFSFIIFYNTPFPPFFEHPFGRPHIDLEYGKIHNNQILRLEPELIGALNALVLIAQRKDVKITIMYGSLIGYYFGKKILPWDDDIDVIVVGERSILSLASLDGWESEDFVFKVNPNFKNKSTKDHWNKIDARMISKFNGVFIDVTFFWQSGDTHFAKDGNRYLNDMLLPLQPAVFCGIDVFVPNDIRKCLTQKYGQKVLHQGVEGFKQTGSPFGRFPFSRRLWEFDGSEWK
jgi:hypothetical protein